LRFGDSGLILLALRDLRVARVVKPQTPNKFRKILEFSLENPANPASVSAMARDGAASRTLKIADVSAPDYFRALAVICPSSAITLFVLRI
jgi:hypothetical protein